MAAPTPGPASSASGHDATFLALQEAVAGRWSLERELGRGGMGIVYLALDVRLDRRVALKLLPPDRAADPGLRERFLREARTAARLSHPHVVPIHAVEEVGPFVFFVMAFVEGPTLGQRVRERGPLSPREGARVLREVAWALAYAHAQGVVHRDVKPDNILLEAGSGRALVTDFGIAHREEEAVSTAGAASVGELLGTPEYLSPEQAAGAGVDARSDLYALGLVGHFALTGRLPFQGAGGGALLVKRLTEPAPPVASVAPGLPPLLAETVDRCLVRDPAERTAGAEAVAEALGRVLQERREAPAAIRAFISQSRESTTAVVGVGGVALMSVVVALVVVTLGEPLADVMPGLLVTLVLALIPVGLLGAMARRLLVSGYGREDLLLAFRQEVEERRQELESARGGERTALDVWAPAAGLGGVALLFGAIASLPFVSDGVFLLLFVTAFVLAMGGGSVTAIHHALGRAVPGERWLSFWGSPPGGALFQVASLGLPPGRAAAGGSCRPTEVVIGLAAGRLFQELPQDVRRSLGDVPGVVRALEGHAEALRERLRELELGRLGPGDGEGPGRRRIPELAGRRAAAEEDLVRAREAAEARLQEVVAALEAIRLELLRLHAGSGTVADLTLDLAAGRQLADDVRRLLEGRRDVDRMLGRARATGDTPVPV